MEPKKTPVYDVHRYRPALFAASLVVSITVVIILFEWSVEVIERKPPPEDPVAWQLSLPEYYTKRIIEDLPKQLKKVDPNKIEEVKDEPVKDEYVEDELVKTTDANTGDYKMETLVELPVEPVVVDTFIFVERMPEPEGGLEHFYKMLRKNLKYPAKARRNGTRGKVFVEFTVSKTGEVGNLKLIKGIGDNCDEEAMRVIALSKWQPGKQRGVPVNVRLVQQIHFELDR
jgi:periplasmic protein TonB